MTYHPTKMLAVMTARLAVLQHELDELNARMDYARATENDGEIELLAKEYQTWCRGLSALFNSF